MGWWSKLWKTTAQDWTYAPLAAAQTPEQLAAAPIAPDSAYLHLWLRSLRLTHVRKGLSRFYGTVHSWVSLPHLSGQAATFQVVTTPGDLKEVDGKNLDRIIMINQRLLGPVPYRGGDLDLEVGLFSIKAADLAGPFVSVLEKMSKLAGVSVVSAAMPFVEPIAEGIDLLAGAEDDTTLEIGLSRVTPNPETGYFVVMRAPRGAVDVASLRVEPDYRLVDRAGKAVSDYPYMVLALEATSARADWFSLPDLASPYGDLQTEVRKGRLPDIEEAFAAFKRRVLTSPDLLSADALRLVAKVRTELESVVGSAPTRAGRTALQDLESIDLYG